MNVRDYLQRIQYSFAPVADIGTLMSLQWHHLLTVPFENIDIQHQTKIVLDTERIFDKVVARKRGGYCYELNSLFADLLKLIGYNVKMISCRVSRGADHGPDFDHMALIVSLGATDYLVDVGFGDFALKPLALSVNKIQSDGRSRYRISEYGYIDGAKYYQVCRWHTLKEVFQPCYIYRLEEHNLADFEDMNTYQQISADSHFVRNFICTKPLERSRVSIVNNKVTFSYYNRKKSRIIDELQRADILEKHFGIRIQNQGVFVS